MGLRSPRLVLVSICLSQKHKSRGMKERLGKHAFRNEYARKDAFLAFNFFSRKFKCLSIFV